MHKTTTAESNNIRTDEGYCSFYPYRDYEENLKNVGYDVIVFIPSIEEDLGRITCGNAILSGTLPNVEYKDLIPQPAKSIKIRGERTHPDLQIPTENTPDLDGM